MRDKWILKKDLTELRAARKLSMEALAELAFTTNTTIFRIEKTGIIADPGLAEKLASIFDIPFDEFCAGAFASDRAAEKWAADLERPYLTTPDADSSYYLVFVRRYEKHGEYSVISPTVWTGFEGTRERRRLMVLSPEGIAEHLAEYGLRCAVVHDTISLIYFYYGIESGEERAALVRTDVAESIYPNLVTDYVCAANGLPSHRGFKDLIQVKLHGEACLPDGMGLK